MPTVNLAATAASANSRAGDIANGDCSRHVEAAQRRQKLISKLGFWFKVKAGPMFNPQTYASI
jgi:hypothetical protein